MVVDIRGDKVRLGLDAPHNVTIHREEVVESIELDLGTKVAKSVCEP